MHMDVHEARGEVKPPTIVYRHGCDLGIAGLDKGDLAAFNANKTGKGPTGDGVDYHDVRQDVLVFVMPLC
jgi:hypothetical protein